MEYLAQVYNDEFYRFYLDTEPTFSVVVVGKKPLQVLGESVRIRETEYRFRVSYFEFLPFSHTSKESRLVLDGKSSGILKSNWCWKHLTLNPSCLLVYIDWDEVSDAVVDDSSISSIFAHLKKHTAYSRSRFILVLVTKNKSSVCANNSSKFDRFHNHARSYFGPDFNSLLQLFESGMDECSLSLLHQMIVELAITFHKGEIVRLMDVGENGSLVVVRSLFKMGWHYLVLKDMKAAKQHFEDGYRNLRETASMWPGTEFRICGTLLVYHILHSAAAEMGGIICDDKYVRFCEDHILWISQPISSSSPENKALSRFLSLLLVGEAFIWMTRDAFRKLVSKKNTFITSAIGAFEEAVTMSFSSSLSTGSTSTALPPEGSFAAPLFVGTETVLMPYSWLSTVKTQREVATWYLTSIFANLNILNSGSALLLFYAARGTNCCHQGEQTTLLLTELSNMGGVQTYLETEAVYRVLMDAYKQFKNHEENVLYDTEIMFFTISLCFGPCSSKLCRKYRELLSEVFSNTRSTNVALSYPRKGHYAPFTVLCGLPSFYYECFKTVGVKLEIFTTFSELFTLDLLSITFVRVDHDGKETVSEHHVTNTSTILSVETPQEVYISLTFDVPGFYECRSVTGRVVFNGMSFLATNELGHSHGRIYLKKKLQVEGDRPGVVQSMRSWFFVVKPVCEVELEVPRSITTIEGDDAVVDIVIKTQHTLVENATLIIPFIPQLYDIVLEDTWRTTLKYGKGYQNGYQTIVLDNLSSLSYRNPLRVSFKQRCLRAGKYEVPILFYFKPLKYSSGEILRKIQVDVNYPFLPFHSIMQTLPLITTSSPVCCLRGTSEIELMVPEMSRTSVQNVIPTLVKSSESFQDDFLTVMSNDIFLYETFVKNEELAHVINEGDEVFLVTTLKCGSVKGLSLLATDVVCTDAVSLISISLGDHPCEIEYMEDMTVAIKFYSTRTGKIPLGFIRLEFSLLGDTQRIVSEIPLPTIVVEDTSLSLILKCPSTVIYGSHFLLALDVVNKTGNCQSCELIVENFEENFCMSGRTQWSFFLNPAGVKTTEFFLQPLRVGSVDLPKFTVRCTAGASTLRSSCVSASQKFFNVMQGVGCPMSLENGCELVEKAFSMAPNCDEDILNQLRQLPLLKLTEKMSAYLVSEEHIKFALYLLSYATIKRDCICDEELKVLLSFFCGKLSIQTAEAAIEAIAVVIDDLSRRRTCSKLLFETLSNDFLGNIKFQALPVMVRRHGLGILAFMISKETTSLFTPRFLRLFLDAVDGESEPDLVVRVFELHDIVVTQVDPSNIVSLLEEFFDSLSSYFPVVFSQPRGCHVTREDIKRALTRCMTRRLYIGCCIPFLLSRLSSPSSVVKQEAIAVLLELFAFNSEYTAEDLAPHCASLVTHIRNEVLKTVSYGDAQNNSYLQSCLELLRYVGRRTHHIPSSSVMLWLDPIFSGFLASLSSEHSVCAAYATMIYHLASSEICCGVALVRFLLPTMLLNVKADGVEHGNKIIVFSALLSGLSDLRTIEATLPGDEAARNSLKEALSANSSSLFNMVEGLGVEQEKITSIHIQLEFLSSFIIFAAWLRPWMPDETFNLTLQKFIILCLTMEDDSEKKIKKYFSRFDIIDENILDFVLRDVIENNSVLCRPASGLSMLEGLMASSPSNALMAMTNLLNPSKVSFFREICEEDIFLLCRNGLALHDTFSSDALLHLVELLKSKNTFLVFEFLCELLIKLPPSRVCEVVCGSRVCYKEVTVFDVAFLSSVPNDVPGIINAPGPYASLLLKTVADKLDLCHLSLQGISALCKSAPGVYEIFFEEMKEANTEKGLAVLAAVARGLLASDGLNQDAVRRITDKILHALISGVDAINALSVTFFLPGSQPSVGLLSCFLKSVRDMMPPVPLNVMRAVILLLKAEPLHSDYDCIELLELIQKNSSENPSTNTVSITVELLECILSYIGADKGLIIKLLLSNKTLFFIVLKGVEHSNLHIRCASLSLLGEVALLSRQWSSSEGGEGGSYKNSAMVLRNTVLPATQSALSDKKRMVRRAAALCRHYWYKLV